MHVIKLTSCVDLCHSLRLIFWWLYLSKEFILHNSVNPIKPMINELTIDQLQTLSGAGTETHWNQKLRKAKGNNNLKQLADSGQLVKKMKYIPGEMYYFIPGDMYWMIFCITFCPAMCGVFKLFILFDNILVVCSLSIFIDSFILASSDDLLEHLILLIPWSGFMIVFSLDQFL